MKKMQKMDPELLQQVNAILDKEIDPLYFEVTKKIAPELADSKYMPWLLAHKMPPEGCKVLLALPDPDWKPGMGDYEVTPEFIQKLVKEHGLTKEFIKKQLEESFYNGDVCLPLGRGPELSPGRGLWFDMQNHKKWIDRNGPAYYKIIFLMRQQESSVIRAKEAERLIAAGKPTTVGRIVPRYNSVKDCPDLLPGENYKEILKSKKLIAQNQCPCRHLYPEKEMDKGVCLAADSYAEKCIKAEFGVEISWEDAFDYVQKSGMKTPLCHITSLSKELEDLSEVLCNCHSEVCAVMFETKATGGPRKMWHQFQKSRFRAVIDAEKCIDCGLCINKRCMFDAMYPRYQRELGKELPQVEEVQCMGCGCCVETCPANAITMKLVDPPEALHGYSYDLEGKPVFRTTDVKPKTEVIVPNGEI